MATKKTYRKIYGSSTPSASSAAVALPLTLPEYGIPDPMMMVTPIIDTETGLPIPPGATGGVETPASSTPDPNAAGQYAGGDAVPIATIQQEQAWNPALYPPSPVFVKPSEFVSSNITRGRPTTDIPEYGSEWGAKNDNRNFLYGLAALGALSPQSVSSYINSGVQGLEHEEDRRQLTARQRRAQEVAAIDQRYQDDISQNEFNFKTNSEKNDSIAALNRVGQDNFETKVGATKAVNTNGRLEKQAKTKIIYDQYKQLMAGVLDQSKKNLSPDEAKKLQDSAQNLKLIMADQGIAAGDVLGAIAADQTLSEMQKDKLKNAFAMNEADNKTKIIDTKLLTGSREKIAALQGEVSKSNAALSAGTQRDIAEQASLDRRYGIDSNAATSAADRKLAQDKFLYQKKIDPNGVIGKQYSALTSELLVNRKAYDDITNEILKFRTYYLDANGDPAPTNQVNKEGQPVNPAAMQKLVDLDKTRSNLAAKSKAIREKMDLVIKSAPRTGTVVGEKASGSTTRSAGGRVSASGGKASERRASESAATNFGTPPKRMRSGRPVNASASSRTPTTANNKPITGTKPSSGRKAPAPIGAGKGSSKFKGMSNEEFKQRLREKLSRL